MGAWGVGSDENDTAQDAVGNIKELYDLYADKDYTELEGEAKADAQDSALLVSGQQWPDHGFVGAVVSLLCEGFRIPSEKLILAETSLLEEDFTGWKDNAPARKAAVDRELKLIKIAKSNAGLVPVELRDTYESKDLIETILSKTSPEAYQEAVIADRAEREASVIPEPEIRPFAWLDDASIKTVAKIARQLAVPLGTERPEIVRAIRKHEKRWSARRFAPYATSSS